MIGINSCRKDDQLSNDISNKISARDNFFEVQSGTDPSVVKLMQHIKNRKVNPGYWTDFAKINGQPVWNKSLVLSRNSSVNSIANAVASRDTIYYIPLVLENDSIVNGYIEARVRDSVQLGYRLAQDYIAYEYKLDNRESQVASFTAKLIALNNVVFGHTRFEFNDQKIFSEDTVHYKSLSIEVDHSASNFVSTWCANTTSTFLNCPWPDADACKNGCDYLVCVANPRCTLITSYNSICIAVDDGIGTSPGNTGGPSGGGDGSSIPHLFPCPNSLGGGCLPPPHNNGPITPVGVDDPPPTNPCIELQPLLAILNTFAPSNEFNNAVADIQQLDQTYEHSYTFGINSNGSYTVSPVISCPNTSSSCTVNSSWPNAFLDLHNHPSNSPPSDGDFYGLISVNANHPSYKYRLVVSRDGSVYALVVNDLTKANSFVLNNPPVIGNGTKRFPTYIVDKFIDVRINGQQQGFSMVVADEMATAYVLEKYNTGVFLAKLDFVSNTFKLIRTSETIQNSGVTYHQNNCP